MSNKPVLILAALAAFTIGCGDLGDLFALQRGIAVQFKTPSVSVNLNNRTHLTVTFANSRSAELPDSERAALAKHVAEYVRDHYHGYTTLDDIGIGFVQSKSVGALSYTSSQIPYVFRTAELGVPQDSTPAPIKQ